jgi:hypothetical protein
MSISFLACAQPVRRRPLLVPRDYDLRDQAIALFDAGDYTAAVRATLQYQLPGVVIANLSAEEFCFVQGSARIRLRIADERLRIHAMLVSLTADSQTTAALRYFLNELSSTGQLFQPRLREQTIALEFCDQLELMHPLKLIEVLQKLPMEADRHDGWLTEHFATQGLDREPIAALSDEEFNRAWTLWTAHWTSVDELMTESRRRRSVRFLDVLSSYAVDNTRYQFPLFGAVRASLLESADSFNDREENPDKRDAALAKSIKQMRAIKPAVLGACLGHAQFTINPLHEGTPSLLSSVLGSSGSMQTTGEQRASGKLLEAALELIANYTYLLAHYAWPTEIETALRAGLDLAAGKSWREAADALWTHANMITRQFGSHGEQERDDDVPPSESRYDAA